ncbi:MAG: hypothetical protein R3293_28375 [Candidatus Promineifilaceae bacterium]|nr:hypothetical protein [Candidatus Promineifilaceae bacterium]
MASDTTNGFKPNDGSNPFKEEAVVISLMRLIEQTKEGEYTCEETLDLLDEYVELVSDGQNVAAIMPLVKNHIGDCPDCTERFEALIKIVQYP